jgi:hypothetical protein
VGGRVDAAGQAADDRISRARQAGRQTFGLCQAVVRGVPRADDRHGQPVAGRQRSADEQHAGRIGNLAQAIGIFHERFNEQGDAVLAAERQLGGHVDFTSRLRNGPADLRPDPGRFAELALRGGQHRLGRAKMRQQRLARSRTHAGNQRKQHLGRNVGRGGIGRSGAFVERHQAARLAGLVTTPPSKTR